LVENHELLEDRRTELRHKNLSNSIPLFIYRSCTHDICKISTFSNFQTFGWIKSKLFTSLIRGFSFYYLKQIDKIFALKWPTRLGGSWPPFCPSHIMTSYCVSITEQTTAKSYLFVKNLSRHTPYMYCTSAIRLWRFISWISSFSECYEDKNTTVRFSVTISPHS
jgi:hypothetical protein